MAAGLGVAVGVAFCAAVAAGTGLGGAGRGTAAHPEAHNKAAARHAGASSRLKRTGRAGPG